MFRFGMLMMLQLVGHCLISTNGLNSFFRYVVNPAKCCLVVHDSYKYDAEQLFSSLGVSVVCNHRYLRGIIGETVGQTTFVQDKLCYWIGDVKCLSKIAKSQPQTSFAALVKLLQCEW